MAERRMFAKTIVTSDAFLDMPLSARCLYFTLGMFADDDGFVNSPKSIMRQVGASMDDMRILIAKKFIIEFEDGVIVIKHWRINNYLRNDRYVPTKYQDHRNELILDQNGAYSLPPAGIPMVDQRYPQDNVEESKGEDRVDKDRESKDNNNTTAIPYPSLSSYEGAFGAEPPQYADLFRFFKDDLGVEDYREQVYRFFDYNEKRGWDCLPQWKEAARRWADRIKQGAL